ncbi:hypothetical protein STH12_03522 [Shewanella khirikhana]|uniref:Transposase IS4-like domain-containing protein n=1 Tax=Shewanella khirikhana TaxID=1965282 RepID=A0ABN5TZB4_9GAMM|nr:hypothetical protein STH12_03522 [Shewanella khirikhana]
MWRKLHLAVDAQTHAIIAAEDSLKSVGDNRELGSLRRYIEKVEPMTLESATSKGINAVILLSSNAGYWTMGNVRNEAVDAPKAGGLSDWKQYND